MSKISVGGIIGAGFERGFKNLLPVVVNILLWFITIWIPYLNIGTTIGITLIVAKMGRGEPIMIGEIFKSENRKRMGEFFLTIAFVVLGVFMAFLFLYIPGIILSIAWGFAILLCVDKGLNPLEAITKSNEATYGHKWTIFFGYLLLGIILMVGVVLITWIFYKILPVLGIIIGIIVYLIAISISMGSQSYLYGELTK